MIIKEKIIFITVPIAALCLAAQLSFGLTADESYTRLRSLTDAKNWVEAEGVSSQALEQFPDNIDFRCYHSWILRSQKKFVEAIDVSRKALAKWPDSKRVRDELLYSLIGRIAHTVENKVPENPLPLAEEAINLAPESEGAQLWYGICLRKGKEYEKAIAVFEKGMGLFPKNIYFKPNLVYSYVEYAGSLAEKKTVPAFDYYKKAYDLDPDNEAALLWYGIRMREKKEHLKAADLFGRGMRKFPGNRYFRENMRFSYVEMAVALADQGKKAEARGVLEKALGEFPGDPLLAAEYAFTYFREDMKKWEELSRATLTLIPASEQKALNTYTLPLKGDRIKVHQGNNEPLTHLGILNGYSWDLVLTDENRRYGTNEQKKEGHYIFNQYVYAAHDGKVHMVRDDSPDTEPMKNNPAYETNCIIIEHEGKEYSGYYHLKKGSSLVNEGDTVRRGQPIAKVGCSGRYVDFPHLHFGISRGNFSVEAKLTGFQLQKNGTWIDAGPIVPQKGNVLKSTW